LGFRHHNSPSAQFFCHGGSLIVRHSSVRGFSLLEKGVRPLSWHLPGCWCKARHRSHYTQELSMGRILVLALLVRRFLLS